MITIITIAFVLLLVIFFLRKNKPKVESKTSNTENLPKLKYISAERTLYKTKGIKSFDIKGTYFANLDETDKGDFFGFAVCDLNSHDQYSVSIQNGRGYHIGYIPKGNKRMHDSIEEWHDGKIIAWGSLMYDDYENKWYGGVYIPVGFSREQLDSITQIFELQRSNKTLLGNENRTIEDCFVALNNHEQVLNHMKVIGTSENLFYNFPKTVLPGLSGKLEKSKDWNNLKQLERYQDLIDDLSVNYKKKLLERIEIAKQNLP